MELIRSWVFSTFKQILPVFNRSDKVDGLGTVFCRTLVYNYWCISILIIIIIFIIITIYYYYYYYYYYLLLRLSNVVLS